MEAAVARVLDANVNRAREALRVLEDFARFDLQDGRLSARIKNARHALAEALNPELTLLLARARDIAADVGRTVEAETEYVRSNTRDVVLAAAKRGTEAFRVLEEYAKIFDADLARRFERLRYELYEIERATLVRIDARRRFAAVQLYVIVTQSLCKGPWLQGAEQAVAGGADCIQLREKSLPDDDFLDRARMLSRRCREAGALMVVNDRADIASLSGADGVHIGQDDLCVGDARRVVGPCGVVGVSTHTLAQARAAMDASPDYIAVGPMFATETKPQPHIPGPALVEAVRCETSLPIVAIGGIDEHNVQQVIKAGATCVCVCKSVIARSDVGAAARTLKRLIGEAATKSSPVPEETGAV